MAKGMNWGIFSLLFVVVGVLGAFAAFFFFLARRAAAVQAIPGLVPLLKSNVVDEPPGEGFRPPGNGVTSQLDPRGRPASALGWQSALVPPNRWRRRFGHCRASGAGWAAFDRPLANGPANDSLS